MDWFLDGENALVAIRRRHRLPMGLFRFAREPLENRRSITPPFSPRERLSILHRQDQSQAVEMFVAEGVPAAQAPVASSSRVAGLRTMNVAPSWAYDSARKPLIRKGFALQAFLNIRHGLAVGMWLDGQRCEVCTSK